MEAPDKIYLVKTTRIINEWRTAPNPLCDNYEYINKNVLVDKLYKWLEEDTTVADYYSKEAFKNVIDKLF